MTSPQFIHLRLHSEYSIVDGLVRIDDAVKAAVMLEDVARTVHYARQAGPLVPIPQEKIDRLYDRYQHVYGQAQDERR